MYIAIVDDNAKDRQEAKVLLLEAFAQLDAARISMLNFKEYKNAEDFLADFQPDTFQIILLDIYMEKQSGMDAARTIRARGETCPIFFLTSSTDHLLEGYLVFAAGYFLKPLKQHREKFRQALQHYLPKLFEEKSLGIDAAGTALDIPLKKIYFIDCNNSRKAIIHLEKRDLATQNSYADCTAFAQEDPRFLECYNHLTVNMDKIADMQEDIFLLNNGARVPISRRKRAQVKEQYIRYITKK